MSKIIHRGTLTVDKLKELAWEHLEIKSDSDEYNPHKNPNAIAILKQEDGNYKGFMQRNGIMIEVRQGKPEDCLLSLITHQ